MAAEDGASQKHLSFLRKIAPAADRYGLFPVLRGAEARAPHLPRIGTSKDPSQNIVDLRQTPTLAFPTATLDAVEVKGGRAEIGGYWLGLTGPMGPLPLHLTEYAINERRRGGGRPFGRFLDLIAGRMLQLFYRAWAESQPAALADRPSEDRFAGYLAALSGAAEGVGPAAALPARARLYYAGLFASRRSAGQIQDALSDLLRTVVRLLEFQARWRETEALDRTRLGGRYCVLGVDAVAGGRIWGVMDAFRIVVRAKTFRDYEAFLPTGVRFRIAAEALDAFTPSHLEWDLALEIDQALARPVRLNAAARLGWTSWLAPDPAAGVRADAHLSGAAARRAQYHVHGEAA